VIDASTFISSNISIPDDVSSLDWLVIGDWGSKPVEVDISNPLKPLKTPKRKPMRKQEQVARSMINLSSQSADNTRFIISTGGK
jgi:hypothetical protein